MKDFTVELTTRKKLLEVNNEMCHNFYYLQHGRIYNADKSRLRRFKFVLWFDIFDVMEYFEKEVVRKQDIDEFANEIAWCFSETFQNVIKSFDDCQEFYDLCNKTIEDYNK